MGVVFAAGVLVPQQFAGQEYFRGAKKAFPGALFPPVPTLADVPARANDLANEINAAFPNGPIHIIAHSMAGLDARFMLSHNLCGLANPGRVASLSMISTPNWGSPIADLLVGPKPSPLDPRWVVYESLVKLAADIGLPLGAVGDLTSSYTATFSPQNPNVGRVSYYCYAGSGLESVLLAPLRAYITSVGQSPDEQANDCLVSVKSASWMPLAEGPWTTADHFSEVGHTLNPPTFVSAFDHIAAYRRILARAGA
jgi:triacylglycerol lipase